MKKMTCHLAAGALVGLLAAGFPAAANAAPGHDLKVDLTVEAVTAWTGPGSQRLARAVVTNLSDVAAEVGEYELTARIYHDANASAPDNRVEGATITASEGSSVELIAPGGSLVFEWTLETDPTLAEDQTVYGVEFSTGGGSADIDPSNNSATADIEIGESLVDAQLTVGTEFTLTPGTTARIPFSATHLDHGNGVGGQMLASVGDPRFALDVFVLPEGVRLVEVPGWQGVEEQGAGYALTRSFEGTHDYGVEVPGELVLEADESFLGGSIRLELRALNEINGAGGTDLWQDNNVADVSLARAEPEAEAPTVDEPKDVPPPADKPEIEIEAPPTDEDQPEAEAPTVDEPPAKRLIATDDSGPAAPTVTAGKQVATAAAIPQGQTVGLIAMLLATVGALIAILRRRKASAE